jgi:hypothetical protein
VRRHDRVILARRVPPIARPVIRSRVVAGASPSDGRHRLGAESVPTPVPTPSSPLFQPIPTLGARKLPFHPCSSRLDLPDPPAVFPSHEIARAVGEWLPWLRSRGYPPEY